jgi:hypothetical protein
VELIQIVVRNQQAGAILSLVQELRTRGWRQGQDFDFAYQQRGWDNMTGEIPPETVFTFYREEIATLFALTYL